MTQLSQSPANVRKVTQLKLVLAEVLAEATSRGFFGRVEIEVSVQDGTIQHIVRRVERIVK
jgi:hypothetical protein